MTDEELDELPDRALLVHVVRSLDAFSGLPKTCADLADQVVKLTTAVDRLEERAKDQTGEIQALDRTLRDIKPKVEKLSALMPIAIARVERAIEKIDANKIEGEKADAELRQSVTDLEQGPRAASADNGE